MDALRLEHFFQASTDVEGSHYRILGGLQQARRAFSHNTLYPHLSQLISLHTTLVELLKQLDGMDRTIPGDLQEIDLETGRLVYRKPDDMAPVAEIIRWGLPHLKAAIEEGCTVFEFVEENLHLEQVGLLPSYLDEGYLIMPDLEHDAYHILQYALSVITRSQDRYRSLKTFCIKQVAHHGVHPSPQHLKLELLAEIRTLPNPATYHVVTTLDFPFEATLLPVAKRKLMRYLTTQGGMA